LSGLCFLSINRYKQTITGTENLMESPTEAEFPLEEKDIPPTHVLALPLALAAFLASCGGGGGPPATPVIPGQPTQAEAARFLLHAQYGANYEDIAKVQTQGFSTWLDNQMAIPMGQTAWQWLKAKGYDLINEEQLFFSDQPCSYMVWYQMMASPDQVRKRFALALSEFFVVSIQGIQLNWPSFAMARYWDILCGNAFGNFRQLLEEVTLCQAMGSFLNIQGNQKADPKTGRVPDENYAREVMQLFSIGLLQLNLDGTPKLGSNGQPLETYTQNDVSNLARVFTGYELDESAGRFTSPRPPNFSVLKLEYTLKPLRLNPNRHSPEAKVFLGTTIPADTDGTTSLKIALDTLFNHPNVGPFFGRQMIQRLVTSNPSPAYVARVASVFNNNGKGVRGDLGAVLRAILLDEEATGSASLNSNTFGKLREPMVRIAQWARTFKVSSAKGTWKMQGSTYSARESIAQNPLTAPSVFNFFRPGYVPPSSALSSTGATAPEFQIVNESTVASYINYLQNILYQGIWVRAPELLTNPMEPTSTDGHDMVPDYSFEFTLVSNTTALVQHLNLLLCGGQLGNDTVNLIVNALAQDQITDTASDNFKRIHVARAIMFVMSSADYLVQR
jgi:uncharacterized protein (DUF1800 family)